MKTKKYKTDLLTGGQAGQFYYSHSDTVEITSVNNDESFLTIYFECDDESLNDLIENDFDVITL